MRKARPGTTWACMARAVLPRIRQLIRLQLKATAPVRQRVCKQLSAKW